MRERRLPYVDIWDRKPIGLFLIYAGIAALGGDSSSSINWSPPPAALATAIVIDRVPAHRRRRAGALLGGHRLSRSSLPVVRRPGGQSPVFYNLLMARAALLALDCVRIAHAVAGQRLRRDGAVRPRHADQADDRCSKAAIFGLGFPVLLAPSGAMAHRSFAARARRWSRSPSLPTALAFAAYAAHRTRRRRMWFATVICDLRNERR